MGARLKTNSRWVSAAALLALVTPCSALAGCGRPAFPADLFTVSVEGADYPMMLSQVPKTAKRKNARPIHAESGTHTAVSQSSYTTGNTTVTVTNTESAVSELPASTKLSAQVQRRDRWVAIDRATWTASDFATYGASSADRALSVDASAYRDEQGKKE